MEEKEGERRGGGGMGRSWRKLSSPMSRVRKQWQLRQGDVNMEANEETKETDLLSPSKPLHTRKLDI